MFTAILSAGQLSTMQNAMMNYIEDGIPVSTVDRGPDCVAYSLYYFHIAVPLGMCILDAYEHLAV